MKKLQNFCFILIASIFISRLIFYVFTPQTDIVPNMGEFDNAVNIELNVTGYVRHLHIKEGDVVRKNQILMELDIPDLSQQVEQAKLKYYMAEAEYQRMLEQYRHGASNPTELGIMAQKVKQAEAVFYEIQSYMSQNTLISPLEGKILKIRVREGEKVTAGRIVLMIMP